MTDFSIKEVNTKSKNQLPQSTSIAINSSIHINGKNIKEKLRCKETSYYMIQKTIVRKSSLWMEKLSKTSKITSLIITISQSDKIRAREKLIPKLYQGDLKGKK